MYDVSAIIFISSSITALFPSMRYNQETELIITLNNLYTSFSSTMTSTNPDLNNQLIVSFTGNTKYNSAAYSGLSAGPFPWTRTN